MNIIKRAIGHLIAYILRHVHIVSKDTYSIAMDVNAFVTSSSQSKAVSEKDSQSWFRLVSVDSETSRAWVNLYTPECYYESHQTLPVDSLSEAYKVAQNLPASSPEPGLNAMLIQSAQALDSQDKHVLNITTIYHDKLRAGLLNLPLAWFFNQPQSSVQCSLSDVIVTVKSENQHLFSTQTLVDSHDAFEGDTRALYFNGPVETFSVHQMCQQLWRSAVRLPLLFWVYALRQRHSHATSFKWQPLVGSTAIAGMLYLLITSVFLSVYEWQIDQNIEKLQTEAQAALDLRRDIRLLSNDLQAIDDIIKPQAPFWTAFPQLDIAFAKEANITAMFVEFDEVRLIGNVERASELLAELQGSPFVQNADFSRAVTDNRRFRNQNFQITWQSQQLEPNEMAQYAEYIDMHFSLDKASSDE